MIDQIVIDKIIYGVDIVSAIQKDGVTLTKKGVNFEGCCPFHNEKTPSFKVSPAKGIFKCFGCGEAGNVIHFYMKRHNMTFPEAVEQLASENNIEYQKRELTPQEREATFKREQLFGINRVALDYFLKSYGESHEARVYAESRWSKETIQDQQLGYAPATWDGFINYAKGLGYKPEIMLEAGLISEGEKGVFDFFRGRLMFPIRDGIGHIVGFSGRDVTKDKSKKLPKYINTKETPIFKKKECLFGFFEARREARKNKRINLVEGSPDVVRMMERGITNTVAPMGTALTPEQIKMIKSEAKSVVIIGDTDDAGMNATATNGLELFKAGLSVSVMHIPNGKDPDEYFKDRTNHYDDSLKENTVDFIDFFAARKLYGISSTAEKADVIREICEIVAYCPEESTIEMYIDKLGSTYKPKSAWTKKLGEVRNKKQMEERTQKSERDGDMWKRYGFVEERNCYYGNGRKANEKWSNFIMQPLAHIRSMTNSKRLYVIKNEFGHEQMVELKQEELVSLAKFRIRVESMGNFLWEANETELFKLKNYLYHNTETCDEITQLGWQKRYGFFAWGNGGLCNSTFTKVDDIGILRIGNDSFYLPAFSKIFNNEVSLFQFERRFIHAQSNGISLQEYVSKLTTVFGDNGKIGFCFLLATLFKDIVTTHTKSFAILNLFGPKGSGKTEMGQSLMSFFVPKNIAPNINNTTIPALGEAVAQVSNALVHIDEYKNSIDIERREFLKGLWDGAGRSRMNMDRDKKREMTTVDSGVILSGQEMPTADIALFSRLIFLTFYKAEYSDTEKQAFKELKRIEGRGLSHLTNEILSHRARVEIDYRNCWDTVATELQSRLRSYSIEDRTLYNWVTPIAALKCLENELQLPFTYQDVMGIATRGIIEQDQKTRQNGELAGFWESVENLVRSSKLWIGVDYHIKFLPGEVKVLQSNSSVTLNPEKQYLQISFNRIAQLYLVDGKTTGDKRIPKDSLKYYLEHSPEFKGTMKSVKFKSIESPGGFVVEKVNDISGKKEYKTVVTTAMVFDYTAIKDNYDIDINVLSSVVDDDPEGTEGYASSEPPPKLF